MFYCPNHSMRIFESGNARFIENGEISGSIVPRDVEIKEVRVQVLLAYASSIKVVAPLVVVPNNNEQEQHNNEPMIHNFRNLPFQREGEARLKGASSKKGKRAGVATNVYSRKTLEKTKKGVCEF